MQNNIKNGLLGLLILCCCIALPATLSRATDTDAFTCEKPTASVTAQGADYVEFAVDLPAGSTTYQYWYENQGDNVNSPIYTASASSLTISDLEPGTYKVYLCTVCGSETSAYIITEIII
jgi:hypothetical protein